MYYTTYNNTNFVPKYVLHCCDHFWTNAITWNQCHSIPPTILGMWWNIMNLVKGILENFR